MTFLPRLTALLFVGFALAACDGTLPRDGNFGRQSEANTETEGGGSKNGGAVLEFSEPTLAASTFNPAKRYNLPELIDLAQSRNPATREAWLVTREAGRQAGIVNSALLPIVTGAAIAGRQSFDSDVDLPLVGSSSAPLDDHGAAVVVTATWLLFDFGENAARQRAVENLARVTEFAFNAVHRQLIFDVTATYHAHFAAVKKLSAARKARTNSADLVRSAERRQQEGLGTTVEVAQAKQLDAQTRLIEQAVAGEVRTTAVTLAALVNVPPATSIRLSPPKNGLPRANNSDLTRIIDEAFLNRSDVRSAIAQVNAAQADLDAAVASYRPKVFGGGYVSEGTGSIALNGLAPIGLNSTGSNGAFIGVSIPIYDGSLRAKRMAAAQNRLERRQAGVEVAKLAATREIAIAYETLRTALALYPATAALTDAAQVTATAAEEAYTGGIGTIGEASAAALGLFAAQEALADAERDARQASAALALAAAN